MGRLLEDPPPAAARLQTESAVIRYNVTAVGGLDPKTPYTVSNGNTCPGIGLTLRYLASDSNAQVVAKLIEFDIFTGAETVRATFDSRTFPSVNDYQVHGVFECTSPPLSWQFNFDSKEYYIEATLTQSIVATSTARIQMIKITNSCFD